ncbi:uncharacterized protein [Zea mays]|uniref:uncharacterized protein n=1 Tax=Zea mays TaxID=4577 RepID=UPI001652FEA3|nr:uncharacterized protein LOC118473107 [Zea mays]
MVVGSHGEQLSSPWRDAAAPSFSPSRCALLAASRSFHGRAPFQQGRPGPDGPCAAPPRGHNGARRLSPSSAAAPFLHGRAPSTAPFLQAGSSSPPAFFFLCPALPLLPGIQSRELDAPVQPPHLLPSMAASPCSSSPSRARRPCHYLAPSSRSELHRRPAQQAARCSSSHEILSVSPASTRSVQRCRSTAAAPCCAVDLRGSAVSASRFAESAQCRRAIVGTRALVDVTPCASLVGKEPKLMACMRGTSRPGPRDDDRASDVVPTTRCSRWTTQGRMDLTSGCSPREYPPPANTI